MLRCLQIDQLQPSLTKMVAAVGLILGYLAAKEAMESEDEEEEDKQEEGPDT